MRISFAGIAFLGAVVAHAQTPASRYPTPPRPLGEAEEIALAKTAAPEEITGAADVYVLRGSQFVKIHAGTNGCACMVGRDLHAESRYPICYDQEGARTWMQREMKEGSLRAAGKSEAEVRKLVEAAFASGELRMPSKPAMAYMMSPRQVLYSSPDSSGVRVGSWWPHVMILMPGMEPTQLGLAAESKVDIIQIHRSGDHHSELIVIVPKWSDGAPVAAKQ